MNGHRRRGDLSNDALTSTTTQMTLQQPVDIWHDLKGQPDEECRCGKNILLRDEKFDVSIFVFSLKEFDFPAFRDAPMPPTGFRHFYHNWTNSILQQLKRKIWKIVQL